ncbi:siderophore-interacting protein [Actinoplanes sp. NPDC051346]|uniref:siderophore-interacting protein n=1 Tax=Actinoplanes sp. NPDC051346 TaxID=3155048 RepID=UPI00341F0D3E
MTVDTPYRFFSVRVGDLRRLSPSFLRVTFTGADLDTFADNGRDQRIKLVFPAQVGGYDDLPEGPDWYPRWRALPHQRRAPLRTYTVSAVRPARREVDVDLVLHGDGGPASRWANRARLGEPLKLMGPDVRFPGDHGGITFRPPHHEALLLAGDETAVPAIASILSGLSRTARGEVILEVPHTDDALALDAPAGVRTTWLARGGAAHGTMLIPGVKAAAERLAPAPAPFGDHPIDDIDIDAGILWEVPDAPAATSGIYAWLAGEAGTIKLLRRYLVAERGIDRRAVAFMGYWRAGRAEQT